MISLDNLAKELYEICLLILLGLVVMTSQLVDKCLQLRVKVHILSDFHQISSILRSLDFIPDHSLNLAWTPNDLYLLSYNDLRSSIGLGGRSRIVHR